MPSQKPLEENIQQVGEELEGQVMQLEALDTQLKDKELVLCEAQECRRMVTQEVNDGVWEWDARSGELYWNDRLFELLGLSSSEFDPTFEGFIELVHPEDRKWVLNEVASCQRRDEPLTAELRVRHATDEYRCRVTPV